jgi:glycosyltransferase involved in cell wall biosynthesis
MKILTVSNLYYPSVIGGAERSAQFLAEGLVRQGHKVSVVTLNSCPVDQEAMVNAIKVVRLGMRNLYFPANSFNRPLTTKILWHMLDSYNPFVRKLLAEIIDKERPDVVHTHNLAGFSVSVWKAGVECNVPVVHTVHDHYLLCPRSTMFRDGRNCRNQCPECRMFSAPRKMLSQGVKVVVGVSSYILNRHLSLDYFKFAVQMVIYNGAVLGPVSQRSEVVTGGPVRIGFLGRLDRTKGVHLLVESFLKLPPGRARLLIAGRGNPDYERELRRMSGERRDIQWLGFVRAEDFLTSVDVLVVPSLLQDAAPGVVTQALAFGVPVIGAKRGGIPELMGEGTGWLFDPEDPEGLTALLRRSLEAEEELRQMGRRARERALVFARERMVADYLRAYAIALSRDDRNQPSVDSR